MYVLINRNNYVLIRKTRMASTRSKIRQKQNNSTQKKNNFITMKSLMGGHQTPSQCWTDNRPAKFKSKKIREHNSKGTKNNVRLIEVIVSRCP